MNFFGQFTQQLRLVWQGMNPGRRALMVLVLVGAMSAVLGVGYWASQPDFRVLYTGLAAEDASAVTTKLTAQGISYKLEAGGTTILVPAEKIQEVRVDLASDGLPGKAGKGFELFDQSPLGMTPFTQQVNYLRALQSELARTIMQIDPIVFARVHLVHPDPSPFVRDQKPTTASVVVKLRNGAALNRNLVSGIVSLVARSVEGLPRENVTIVDTNGKLLSEEQSPETGAIGSQMDYRRDLEAYLSSRAETMLAQVVGPGRALVRVTADINFQRHHEKRETYNPESRAVLKETITTSKSSSGTTGSKGGAAGTSSNLGKSASSASGSSGNNSDESIATDFAVSKVTQEFEDKMGAVERLTIAAFIDLSSDDKDKKNETTLTLTDAQEIIKQAVGFKQNRDEIKVTNAHLTGLAHDTIPDEEWETAQRWQSIAAMVRNASLGVASLTALVMGWMLLRRMKPDSATQAQAPVTAPATQNNPLFNRLEATAQQNPEALARILASWLEQSEDSNRMAA